MISRTLRVLTVTLLLGSCGGYGSDGGDYGDDDSEGVGTGGASRDAGKDASAQKDAGKRDAGVGSGGGGYDYDEDEATEEETGAADAGAVDASSPRVDGGASAACADLTYETFGKAFLTSYCVSCHSAAAARGGVQLDSLAALQGRKAGVKAEVLSGGMPQGNKKPSEAERTRLGQWIDCGAK